LFPSPPKERENEITINFSAVRMRIIFFLFAIPERRWK